MSEPIDEVLKVTRLVVTGVALGAMAKNVLLLNNMDSPNPTPQETEEVRCEEG